MGSRLSEGLAFEWRAERHAEVLLEAAAERVADAETSERIEALGDAATTRRQRVERRLDALGGTARLAPMPSRLEPVEEVLELALAHARAGADRYAALAELARRTADPESAFACELNRIGAEEAAQAIEELLGRELERAPEEHVGAPA